MGNSRTVIITGAANGIGRAIALEMADDGWRVIVVDIDAEAAQELAGDIQSRAGSEGAASAVSLDVSSEGAVTGFFTGFRESGTAPTALINNAGVQTWCSLLDLSLADWNRTLAVNLTGCFLMTREFARLVKQQQSTGASQRADIVNIGSGCNKLAFPNLVDYTASKGGIEMFTKSAALELGPLGICVNCIAPGAIETERTAAETGDYANTWAALTPLQRVGQVPDVAKAVNMLLQQPTGFITGQTLAVDGGLFSAAAWPREY